METLLTIKSYCQLVKMLIQLMHFFRFNLLQNYCKACKMRIFRSCNLSRITESSKLSNALSTRACSYYNWVSSTPFYHSSSSSFFILLCISQTRLGQTMSFVLKVTNHNVVFSQKDLPSNNSCVLIIPAS